MTLEKEKLLFAKYSSLFEPEEIRKDETKSCMAWGFDCDDGWFNIIDNMLAELQELHIEGLFIEQIKEKFGTLRVYTSGAYQEVFDIVDKYETMSENICEICGKPGKLDAHGWYKTLCEEHLHERQAS